MIIDLQQLSAIIREVSKEILLPHFNAVSRQYKQDGSVVTVADKLMQTTLATRLSALYPDIGLLGEEMSAPQQQQLLDQGTAIWCLDPIDGTSNFASGMPYFSVSLALLQDNQVSHGLVYDPILDECFTAQRGKGAWLNGQRLHTAHTGLDLKQTLAMIDFKRLPAELARRLIEDRPYGSQRSLGSIALELCWLAAGRAQIYLHGNQLLWDYAAAQLIISEAGGQISTLEGHDLASPSLTPRSACAAVDDDLFAVWKHYLQQLRQR